MFKEQTSKLRLKIDFFLQKYQHQHQHQCHIPHLLISLSFGRFLFLFRMKKKIWYRKSVKGASVEAYKMIFFLLLPLLLIFPLFCRTNKNLWKSHFTMEVSFYMWRENSSSFVIKKKREKLWKRFSQEFST
jgi:hypothetical protein